MSADVPSVLVAVPTFESISPDTFESLWDMDKSETECMFRFVRGYDCAKARCEMAKLAMKLGTDYILMVDSDVVVPSDALVTMLGDDVDVCLGFYQRKSGPKGATTLCELGRANYDVSYHIDEIHELRDEGRFLIEVKGGGLGCALIRTHVFGSLPYPWFDYEVRANGSALSEDYFFSSLCRRHGIKTYADTRVACGHRLAETRWLDG